MKVEALDKLFSDQHIEAPQPHFVQLLSVIERNGTHDSLPENPNEINMGNRYGSGTVVAVVERVEGEKEDREIVGTPDLIRSWVEGEVQDWLFKIGVTFLAAGFLLQLAGRVIT